MPSAKPASAPRPDLAELQALAMFTREAREAATAAGVKFPTTAARQHLALLDGAQRGLLGKPPRALC
jgi:hypothetical protein